MKRDDIIVGQDYWLDRDYQAPEDHRVMALHLDKVLCRPDYPGASREVWARTDFASARSVEAAVYHVRALREKEARTHVVVGGFYARKRHDGTWTKEHRVFPVTLNQLRGSWQVVHDMSEARLQEKLESQREERERVERDNAAFDEVREMLEKAGFEGIQKSEDARDSWRPHRTQYHLPLSVIQHLAGAYKREAGL